ncbi:MAG: SnoaL-like domain-containing protein [Polyangiaceae bacterium]|nr:SnoaL-like domain-containing protein [Polyangiaceae bacterium]
MDRRLLIGLGVCGAAAVTFGVFFMSSDEDEIRALCDKLEAALTFPAERGNPAFFALSLKEKLGEVLAPNAQVVVPEAGEGPLGIQAVVGGAMQIAGNFKSAGVELEDLEITINGSQATVEGRAVATAFEYGGGPQRHERRVRMEVDKIDGDWRFTRITATRNPDEP